MLLENIVKIKWNKRTKEWYIDKGYKFTKMGDEFIVKTDDLPKGSNVKVKVKCDNCIKILDVFWNNYLNHMQENNTYYCGSCAHQLYGGENIRITKFKNGISLFDWCINNDKQDIIERWDYNLNKCSPKDINCNTVKKYWLKCPEGLHKSELQDINNFVGGSTKTLNCKECNSFAQWLLNTYGEHALNLYWDYEKNVGINPWKISRASGIKIWIKCQEKDYHDSYEVRCTDFINKNSRCPYCKKLKIHLLDSLGTLYPKSIILWSEKNKKSPYEYSPHSAKSVWWKCPSKKHKDYKRCIQDSVKLDFHCRKCNFSKGEKQIENWLINNNIKFESQKTFEGLTGMGNGLLSYDFYLPSYNLLIEYQGEYHDGTVPYQSDKQFEYQQEHDRRKKQYAKDNNIKLLEIWYCDYENIEEILDKKFKGDE